MFTVKFWLYLIPAYVFLSLVFTAVWAAMNLLDGDQDEDLTDDDLMVLHAEEPGRALPRAHPNDALRRAQLAQLIAIRRAH